MRTLKHILKPDWRKIVVFVIILILSNIPYIGYFIEQTNCPISDIPCLGTNSVNIFNPILNPIFWLWGGEDDIPLATRSYSGLENSYYILMILNVVYWYLLSCLIVWFYDKLKGRKK